MWGELITKLALFSQTFFTGKPVDESKAEATFNKKNRTLCFRVEQLLVNCIKQMPDLFPIINVKLFFMSTFRADNPSELLYADFQEIVEASEIGFSMLLKEVINCATKEWRDFVRGELGKGGGVLYKYISKEEKAYLNVDISKFCVSNFSPSDVLSQQAKNWSQLWAPPDPQLK
jgi:hypothetical protein